jgi:hypothetical protein
VVAWTTFVAGADWNNFTGYWQIAQPAYKLEYVLDAGKHRPYVRGLCAMERALWCVPLIAAILWD